MDIRELSKQIRQVDVYSKRLVGSSFAGNYKSSFKGQGIEVADLRPYVPGDDMRSVDWRTTARKGDLYVREYHETRELTTLVMVDVSPSMQFGSAARTKAETAVTLAGILMYSALKTNDRFASMVYADQVYQLLPFQKGEGHWYRSMKSLIEAYDRGYEKPSNPTDMLAEVLLRVPAHAICFLITDELPSQAVRNLRMAGRKYDLVVLNVFDPLERELPEFGVVAVEQMETGERGLIDLGNKKVREAYGQAREGKYAQFVETVRQAQIDQLDVSVEDDVASLLLQFFQLRQRRN